MPRNHFSNWHLKNTDLEGIRMGYIQAQPILRELTMRVMFIGGRIDVFSPPGCVCVGEHAPGRDNLAGKSSVRNNIRYVVLRSTFLRDAGKRRRRRLRSRGRNCQSSGGWVRPRRRGVGVRNYDDGDINVRRKNSIEGSYDGRAKKGIQRRPHLPQIPPGRIGRIRQWGG